MNMSKGKHMNTLLDTSVFSALEMITNMTSVFAYYGAKIARLCFIISFGITLIKVMFGMEQLSKALVKQGFNVVTYFLLVALVPTGTAWLQKVVNELANSASDRAVTYDLGASNIKKQAEEQKFLEWVAYESDLFFVKVKVFDSDNVVSYSKKAYIGENEINYMRNITSLKLRRKDTGILSIDRVLKLGITTILMMIKAMFLPMKISFLKLMGVSLITFLIICYVVFLMLGVTFTLVVNYIMVLVEYSFFTTTVLFFLPFMLWEGTAFISKNIFGTLLNINVKLLVSITITYLVCFGYLEILRFVYDMRLDSDFLAHTLTLLILLFKVFFYKLLADSSDKLASMLCGGSPSLGFGDFTKAVASTAQGMRNGAMLASAPLAVAGAVKNTASALQAGGRAFSSAVKDPKNEGASAGFKAISGAIAGGQAIAQSIKTDKQAGDAKGTSVGAKLKGMAQGLEQQIDPRQPIWSGSTGGGYKGGNGGSGGGGLGGGAQENKQKTTGELRKEAKKEQGMQKLQNFLNADGYRGKMDALSGRKNHNEYKERLGDKLEANNPVTSIYKHPPKVDEKKEGGSDGSASEKPPVSSGVSDTGGKK